MTLLILLKQLVSCPGVSGFESTQGITRLIANLIKTLGYDPAIDTAGNVTVQIGSGKNILLIEAHLDEVGLCLTNQLNPFTYQFVTIGQSIPQSLPNFYAVSQLGTRRFRGKIVSSAKPATAYADLSLKFPQPVTIPCGSVAYFQRSWQRQRNLITSPALDNRVGCAALICLLSQIMPIPGWTVIFAFTNQEEQGLGKGAAYVAQKYQPKLAIVIDSAYAQSFLDTGNWVIPKIGQGPALQVQGTGFINDQQIMSLAQSTAQINHIPLQLEILDSTEGYTNVQAINRLSPQTKTLGINIPVARQDTPKCQASLKDIELTTKLINLIYPQITQIL